MTSSSSTWIFGYGSLIHKPGFAYSRSVQGYIKGYRRVFWQGSTDHRGTPEAPGRTVTLTPDADAITWGVAFELTGTPQAQQQALQYLEWREKQYDVRLTLAVFNALDSETPAVEAAVVYLATHNPTTNVNYLGPASEEAIARQIAAAAGPSGPNYEYVYKLADAMRQMGVQDAELFSLEARVRAIRGDPLPAAGSSHTNSSSTASTDTALAASCSDGLAGTGCSSGRREAAAGSGVVVMRNANGEDQHLINTVVAASAADAAGAGRAQNLTSHGNDADGSQPSGVGDIKAGDASTRPSLQLTASCRP